MASPLNTWGGLSVQFPPVLSDAQSEISGVMTTMITALDVTLRAMEIAKAFAIGSLDPVHAILQAVVTSLQGTITDLRQAGLYFHGDHFLIAGDPTLAGIRGGYGAYERRMVQRLLNQTDPNRPNFTLQTAVVGLFFYTGGDISQIEQIIESIRSLVSFFGQRFSFSALPVPTSLKKTFAVSGTSIQNLTSFLPARSLPSGIPDTVTITWNLAAPSGSNETFPLPVPPPSGFLVEVSTLRDGLYLGWSAPRPSGTGGNTHDDAQSYQSGLYLDGGSLRPIQIYGGSDELFLGPETSYNNSIVTSSSGTRYIPGTTVSYALRTPSDVDVIPLELLQSESAAGRPLFQRTFYVPRPVVTFLTGGSYSISLKNTDMPYTAQLVRDSNGAYSVNDSTRKLATSVFVRVSSVSGRVSSNTGFQWEVHARSAPGLERLFPHNPYNTPSNQQVTLGSKGTPSSVLQVSFPNQNVANYLNCIRTALIVAVLSRSDLTESHVATPTGLEGVCQEILPRMYPNGNLREALETHASASSFRRDLFTRATTLAEQILQEHGQVPDSVLAPRLAAFRSVLDWTWVGTTSNVPTRALPRTTILESMQDTSNLTGVNKNLGSIGSLSSSESARAIDSPTFFEGFTTPPPDPIHDRANSAGFKDLSDYLRSPIFICQDSSNKMIPMDSTDLVRRVWYARQLFDTPLYTTCQQILQLAAIPRTQRGQWVALRFFPNGLPALETVFREISDFCQRLADATQGITDILTHFIDFYEQRVRELQELLNRINGLLGQLNSLLELPQFEVLALVSDGTDGVLGDLLNAQNKPNDGPNAFSAGCVGLFGGIPAYVTDLLLPLFEGSTSS